MRRSDREIVDEKKIEEIISSCYCCRLGFNDNGQVYIVPLNFGYEKEKGKYVFYFHGAAEGRKMELMKTSPYAGFEMDTHYQLNEGTTACGYSARFQSVIGNGMVSMVEEPEEKRKGLIALMRHSTGKNNWDFTADMLNSVSVFKLTVEEISCKEHP